MVNKDPLFFHQQENVNEQVMELLHAVLKAQQLLLLGKRMRPWGYIRTTGQKDCYFHNE